MKPSPALTLVLGLIGVIVGALLTFTLNKVTKRQERRDEWYENVDKQLADMETRLKILEYKVGIFFRGIEDHVVKIILPEKDR